MEEQFVIQSTGDETIRVNLPNQLEINHKGSAVVQDGHLYLRGNPAHQFCETNAIYAPGQWLSVSLMPVASHV